MPHATPLITLISAGMVLAFVLGWISQKFRLSPLVGYLLAGILIGPFTPGFIGNQALANELAEIGVILLMFGVGLHFSLDDLMKVKAIAIPGAIVQILVATLLGWALALWLGWSHIEGIVFGLALSVASTVVLLRALEDNRLIETQRGKIAIGWLVVEDLVMILALVILPAVAMALHPELSTSSAKPLWLSLLITLGKLGLFVALMLIVGKRAIPWTLEKVAGNGSQELFTLAVLAIALGVAFGSAKLFGVSFALGAFFAGMLLNESELSHKAASDTLPMRDAFAVLFFVSVGMLFDPRILIEQPLPVIATFIIITLGKSAAAFLIVRLFGHPKSTAFTIAASLAQIGEFSFILASLGVGLKLLPEQGRDFILAGALLSIVVNPMIFTALARWQKRRKMQTQEASGNPESALKNHAIVIGYGRVGKHLAKLLQDRGVELIVIDSNGELVEQARDNGMMAIRGNAASAELLNELSVATATHALIAIPNAYAAGEIIARLRSANPAISILARAHSDSAARHFFERGADGAVLAERELAHSMAEMVLNDPSLITAGK
ncbi:MAG TPA: YbaL family putative K(+) efflux transporter [Arenimonas sp.]|nr:YbaL family putative K(+) efflux transporter [Arenimonas sp.]HOZ03923.1 YbaL family putative K(+) efflux transporter [Arenimonas sp.]HPO23573.1 YbaL family putative K(+) efflux transporter [Arenimonas sp.]HPW33521.1 YbaL family putative K(+) efflux transporter [Arenimonas sp.]